MHLQPTGNICHIFFEYNHQILQGVQQFIVVVTQYRRHIPAEQRFLHPATLST